MFTKDILASILAGVCGIPPFTRLLSIVVNIPACDFRLPADDV